LYGDAIGESPYTKLAGFAQRMLCSEYHTPMQKWNKYYNQINVVFYLQLNNWTGKCNFECRDWIEKRQYYKACYDYDRFQKQWPCGVLLALVW